MPQKVKSVVWRYFEKLDRETVMCKLCQPNRTFKFQSNTSNMKSHLKSKHPDADLEDNEYKDPDYEDPNTSSSHLVHIDNNQIEDGDQRQVFEYQKLVVPMAMRSVYWKSFGFPANANGDVLTKQKIVCLLCKSVISYNRNTSNLKLHLQNKHEDELNQLELSAPIRETKKSKLQRGDKKKKYAKLEGNIYTSDIGGTVTIGNSLGHNSTFHTSVSNEGKNVVSSTPGKQVTVVVQGSDGQNCTIESLHPFMLPIHSNNVSDAIAEFIVLDLQLPDIVEGRGFQRLIATLKSPCEIPSRSKLIDEVIPRMYDTVKEIVQNTLMNVKTDVALTVEEWSAQGGETFVTFSVCYQQEKDDNLYSKVLTTIHCPPTAETIYWDTVFDNILEEWNIKIERVKAVVYGACRDEIVHTIANKGLILLPCLAQTIQEVVTTVCFEQDDVKAVLAKCRAFIYLIYKHNNALAASRIQDHLMSLEEIPLLSDYPRVWITSYQMLEGFLARRQVVASILDNVESSTYDKESVSFSDQDWALIEDVLAVLEPFKVTMMTLSEEKSPLVSLLKPLLWQLVSCHLQTKMEESVNAQIFKTSMRNLLASKYNEPAVNRLLQTATSLDPRFKNLPNMADETKAALEGHIRSELTMLINSAPVENRPVVEGAPEKKKSKLSGIMMLMGDVCPSTASVISNTDRASLEIVQYQSEPTASLDQCPLAWWTRSAPKCPHLTHLATKYLCVPATALPPPRLPPDQQSAYDAKRQTLPTETIDKLTFLHSNYAI